MVADRRARSNGRCGHVPRRLNGERFKEARLIAGYDRKAAAALLGVTARTIRNWESRRVRVPYSAFKLMRILSGYALPGEAWSGWCLRAGALWSPEQRSFRPHELSWWGLTVAMARAWQRRYETSRQARVDASEAVAQITITVADVAPGGLLSLDTCEGLTAFGGDLDLKSGRGSASSCELDAGSVPIAPSYQTGVGVKTTGLEGSGLIAAARSAAAGRHEPS